MSANRDDMRAGANSPLMHLNHLHSNIQIKGSMKSPRLSVPEEDVEGILTSTVCLILVRW